VNNALPAQWVDLDHGIWSIRCPVRVCGAELSHVVNERFIVPRGWGQKDGAWGLTENAKKKRARKVRLRVYGGENPIREVPLPIDAICERCGRLVHVERSAKMVDGEVLPQPSAMIARRLRQ
jgi:hypothetical protein